MLRLKSFPSSQYWLPIVPARFAQAGRSGSAGRLDRVEADVAEAAGHADQVRRLHVAGMLQILGRVPLGGIEPRIGKFSQADNAAGVAGHAGNRGLIAAIEPEPVLIGCGRRLAARLRDRAQLAEPAPVAARVEVAEQVDAAVGHSGHLDPEALAAAGPEIPGVATLALLCVQVVRVVPVVIGLCSGL